MEKVSKAVRIITIILMVILVSVIAFGGFYLKSNHIWKNVVPEFNYGLELNGVRELRFILDTSEEEKEVYIDAEGNILGEVKEDTTDEEVTTEETVAEEKVDEENAKQADEKEEPNYATEVRTIKANDDTVKTIENFEKAKSIIQERLENEDVYEYNIRLDNITGELILEVPDNDESISVAQAAVMTVGKFEIIDDQTGIILMDQTDIKEVQAGMYQEESGYQACLQVVFNQEGKEKLKNISNQYREVVNDAGESETTYVAVSLDGQTLTRTYFAEELSNGVIQIPVGTATTDSITMNETLKDTRRIANMIDKENLPIVYTLTSDNFVQSRIDVKDMQIAVIVFVIIILVVSIALIIKFKLKGLVSSILAIGFISILSLIARYTGVYITVNAIITFVCMVILNYVFMVLFLLALGKTENRKEAFLEAIKKYYLAIIPVCVIAIVFTFISNIVISSIGMI